MALMKEFHVRAALAMVVLIVASASPAFAQNETQPVFEGDFYTFKIAADGMPLETLVQAAEAATGRAFIYSDAIQLKGKIVKMLGTARVPKSQIFSLYQAIFVSQGYALTPLGDEKIGVLQIESIEQGRFLKQRAPFVHVDSLEKYKNDVGTVIMTSIPLRYIKVANVRGAVSQILGARSAEFTQEVESANALIVVAFAPTVFAIKQIVDAMDVPQIEATLKFEIIHLQHAVADELQPIIKDLISTDTSGAQRARPVPSPEGGGFGGAEKPEPKLISDPRTNNLVIYAVESDVNKIKVLVNALDTEIRELDSNIRVYMLKNQNAPDLVDVLKEVLGQSTGRGSRPSNIRGAGGQGPTSITPQGQEVSIVADPNNNALLITASKTRYAEILPIIQALDQRRPQVLVQAAIAELSDSDTRNIGVEITALQGGNDSNKFGAVTGFGLSTITTTGTAPNINLVRVPFLSGSGTAQSIALEGGIFGIFNNDLNVPLLISMLKRTTKSNLVSVPSVLTNDNEESRIEVSRQVATSTFQTSQAGTDSQNFGGYQEAKIELIISPHISNDNYLRLEVELTVEAFVGTSVSPVIPPDKTRRKLVGSVTLPSGRTVVIGGLVQDNDSETLSAVPFLSDIPLLGELFKNTSTLKEKTTLYVFITPTILNGFDKLEEISYERKAEIDKLDGQIKLVDPHFRPILLDDREVKINDIENSGSLDLPRYAPVVPQGTPGTEAIPDAIPVRPKPFPTTGYGDQPVGAPASPPKPNGP